MAASPSGAAAAAGAIHGHQAPAKQQQQAAAQLAGQPLPLPPQQEAASTLFDLLQQAMDVAAAAASGLTLELAAAFAMLLPLPDQKVNLGGPGLKRGCNVGAGCWLQPVSFGPFQCCPTSMVAAPST